MHRNLARMASCVLVLAGTLPALAAEGRIPIFAPTVIVADGKYIVTRDIVGAGGSVIDVLAANVDIDLNGFTLTEPAIAFPVINAAGFVTHLTIRNGALNSGTIGIEALSGDKIVIEDVKIQFPATTGIHVFDILSIAIRRVMIQGVMGGPVTTGILIDNSPPFPGHTATIESNVIRDVGGDGIAFFTGSVAILNNRIANTGIFGGPGAAILLTVASGSLVSENTILGSGTQGIFLRQGTGNKLFDNVVQGSGGHGIHLDPGTGGTLVLNNVATGNGFPGAHGLFVDGSYNHIDRNTLNFNSGYGLFFTGGAGFNTFGRNMARGNGGPLACPGLFPPDSCDVGFVNSSFGDNLIPGPPIF